MTASPEQFGLGYRPGPGEPDLEIREHISKAFFAAFAAGITAPGIAALPSRVDLRNYNGKNFVTPVRNQGRCGSCVSFGSIAAVEATIQLKSDKPNSNIDLSEAHLFYCHAASDGCTCDTGWYVKSALNHFRADGVVGEPCFPYTAGDQPCSPCQDEAQQLTKISDWTAIASFDAMRSWLAESRGPLVTGFSVYADFYAYQGGVYRYTSGAFVGGHCVCVVGYDDTAQCWICKNSWGQAWGEKGFFRIGYGEVGIDATMWGVSP
jgi:C1A family cysteine protease